MKIELIIEICKFRNSLENSYSYNEEYNIPYYTSDFPEGNCMMSSYLLCEHIFNISDYKEIKHISASTYDHLQNESIVHHWLEIEGNIIDITADQYNSTDEKSLNYTIVTGRPYLPVIIAKKDNSYLHNSFSRYKKDLIDKDLSVFGNDAIHNIKRAYKIIMENCY